jgi:pyridinium-3,5-biscarboxylic acid mononucleotide sulfurtransferase
MDPYHETVARIAELGPSAVCFSGGFDSTFLLAAAREALGDRCTAVFADIPLISDRQRRAAVAAADSVGARMVIVKLGWDDMPGVESNGPDRCYLCKRAIYSTVSEVAKDMDFDNILCGDNADDAETDRPGRRARGEYGICAPLEDLGIRKPDIISAVSSMDLGTSMMKDTCMATRIPVGTGISEASMRLVENCEAIVREVSGIGQVRFRIRGDTATIQTSEEETATLKASLEELETIFGEMGMTVDADIESYKGL